MEPWQRPSHVFFDDSIGVSLKISLGVYYISLIFFQLQVSATLQTILTCTDVSLIPSSVARASRTVTPGYLFHWKTASILSSCLTVKAVLLRRCPCLGPGGILLTLPDFVELLSSVKRFFFKSVQS